DMDAYAAQAAKVLSEEPPPVQMVTKRRQLAGAPKNLDMDDEDGDDEVPCGKKVKKRPAAATQKAKSLVEEADEDLDEEQASASKPKLCRRGRGGRGGQRGRGGRGDCGGRGGRDKSAGRGRGRGRGKPSETVSPASPEGSNATQAFSPCEMSCPEEMEEEDYTWPDENEEMYDDDIPAKRPAARVKASKPPKASTHGRVLEEPVQDKAAKKKARHTEAVQDDDEAEATPPPKKKKHGASLQHTDAEEGESPPSEGKLTFAGRKQPAHGLPHMKWAVLRDAFRDH
ncbi:unnamed protein product, partial [Symbiodinium pilosum]